MEIRDNVFLITGGASGLGAATARLFAAEGGKIVVADLNQDAGVALAQELGGVFVKCDLPRGRRYSGCRGRHEARHAARPDQLCGRGAGH